MAIFKNRAEAGKKLASLLNKYKHTNAIVLALPRGGIIVGKEVAQELGLSLDIIVTRKIGAPGNNEYAIGAIDINGNGVWNESERAYVDEKWLKNKITEEKKEAERRLSAYRKGMGPLELKDKIVIIVDDGIATGLTMQAAVAYAKYANVEKVVVAAPVASIEALATLKKLAEVYVIETPVFFSAVGEWYEEFPQVEDLEVIKTLAS